MLNDLKIIEFAGVLAGPAVGMFFAELGAEVIKIENPSTGGDMTRKWKLASEDAGSESSAYFASVNWGKNHKFIDLNSGAGKSEVSELVRSADIIISNWKKGDAEKFGVDEIALRKINPGLIIGQLSGFGDEDDRVAYDIVLQAETGWMDMNGDENSEPVKIPVAIVDLFAAHQLKEGILMAYIHKLKTGKGSTVSVSLFDASIASLANQASNYLMTGEIPKPSGSLHPNIAPYGEMLNFSDGVKVVLAIGTDKQFSNLCDVLNCNEISSDKRFITNKHRVANRIELLLILKSKSENYSGKEFLTSCFEKNIPVGEIRNLKEVFALPAAQKLILSDEIGKRIKTVVFKIIPAESSHSE